ncbi:hypothetical protein ACW6QP_04160 [Salegentibacter sp. HM20]
MKQIIIKYSPKRLKQSLIFGVFWTILGFLKLNYTEIISWIDYGYLVVAVLYWTTYLYEKNRQYLTIDANSIRKNTLPAKRIDISEIIQIKKFPGKYILISDSNRLSINIDLIEKDSLIQLNQILAELDLPETNSPFKNLEAK